MHPQTCKLCGRVQHVVWTVNDNIWDKVVAGTNFYTKTLCLECFAKLAGYVDLGDVSDKVHFENLWSDVSDGDSFDYAELFPYVDGLLEGLMEATPCNDDRTVLIEIPEDERDAYRDAVYKLRCALFELSSKRSKGDQTPEQVKTLVNELLGDLCDRNIVRKWRIQRDAINWGDLRCADVKQFKDGSWVIWVEECDPSACHLQTYLTFKLRERGIKVDHVICEW